ncbi:MAG TPA: hypothetical protein VMT37_07130 [Solirubrobacterales bacterium]|nr:hypothetical protein [Solirubrobacterales bacterium]
MKRIVGKLTYANVMATVAVFIALGGASYAAFKLPKNSVGTKQIKNNAITAAKIKNGAIGGAKIDLKGLGQVPNAAHADSASALAAPEQVHLVTEFEHGFHNNGEGLEKAGYYLDRQCEVHLNGSVVGKSGQIAFVLPEGFRPPGDIFASIPTGVGPGYLELHANGSVQVGFYGSSGELTFGLDGVTYRVAGC